MTTLDELLRPEERATEVGYLVQIDADIVYRFCSWDNVIWQGELWTNGVIKDIKRTDSAPYAPSGSLTLNDPDLSLTAAMLRHGSDNNRIMIWYTASFDFDVEPVLWLDAYTDDLADTPAGLTIGISPTDAQCDYSPRRRISPRDYKYLLAPGVTLNYAGGKFTLQTKTL